MGNSNVLAGPKEEDNKGIEDQQNPRLEEINGIVPIEKVQAVSEDGIKDLSEQIEESSSEESSGVEDPRAEKQMSDSTEDIKAQSEVSKENGKSPSEEMQELAETEAVNDLSEELELLGDNDLDAIETILENEETKDTDLLRDRIDEKQENGANLVHDTDSELTKNISGNEENKDYTLPVDEFETENVSFGDEIKNIDIGEKESQIEDNVNREVIKQTEDLEEVTKITPEVETVAPDLTATMEEGGDIETKLPIPNPQEADSENETQDLENGSIQLINSEHDAGYELVTLKLSDSEYENKELQALEPTADIPEAVPTKLMTDLETGTISVRLSTGSIQDKPSLNPELRKSPSFIFDLPLESKCEESDQTPLLYHNKAICRSISSPSSQPISVEEKTIQVERSDSDKLKGPFSNLLKKEGLDNFLKQDCQTSSSENALTKGSGKRKPRPSMFTTCLCCATAIS